MILRRTTLIGLLGLWVSLSACGSLAPQGTSSSVGVSRAPDLISQPSTASSDASGGGAAPAPASDSAAKTDSSTTTVAQETPSRPPASPVTDSVWIEHWDFPFAFRATKGDDHTPLTTARREPTNPNLGTSGTTFALLPEWALQKFIGTSLEAWYQTMDPTFTVLRDGTIHVDPGGVLRFVWRPNADSSANATICAFSIMRSGGALGDTTAPVPLIPSIINITLPVTTGYVDVYVTQGGNHWEPGTPERAFPGPSPLPTCGGDTMASIAASDYDGLKADNQVFWIASYEIQPRTLTIDPTGGDAGRYYWMMHHGR